MGYINLLSDRCFIYHLNEIESINSFTFIDEIDFVYNDIPDELTVSCYFVPIDLDEESIINNEPFFLVHEKFRVFFPINTDIRLNDLVEWNGVKYKAEKPMVKREHHIEVLVKRNSHL
ncbi:DUF3599 family protein [Chengkuizengella axinellae]|uniref:DUF3599 family protein n=1 Tax=Chengkuizengella axinellae TaxID=3064388 RepID=A0ABT9IW26_9BACL|nr:DUF3599 family protein [Chengkuizengella sp. 2205SS18-9]MDP5273545.1 DUF3599 family protein [Chengkuizengella sp. 2205SS18-9]